MRRAVRVTGWTGIWRGRRSQRLSGHGKSFANISLLRQGNRNHPMLHRMEKAMLKHRFKASTLARVLWGIASIVALGVAMTMPAHADIKIGFQVPLTGPAATDGKSAQIAGQMAVEDINAAGGVLGQKIELVTYDD